jgi:acetoin utilization deacetylase AcuC-like enzyme
VTLAVCWSEQFAIHDSGRAGLYLPVGGLIEDDLHVDNTARIIRTRNLLRTSGIDDAATILEPRDARMEEVLRAHSEEHVVRMQKVAEAGGGDAGGGYTPMDERSYELALLSAGSALTALEAVVPGERTAHALLRRSGHHAWRDSGYGFCVFNNCAIVARAARDEFGFERIAVVDIDAHHGNGTEAIFFDDPGVLTVSLHQDRSFPVETGGVESVGEGDAEGTNMNVNLPAGAGDPAYLDAFDRIVVPVLLEYRPQLVIVACGVDASLFDPMARLGVTATGFAGMAERLLGVADEVAGGRLVSVQEGGYSPVYSPFCWLAFIETIGRLEVHADPFEDFIAEQSTCRELAPWQVEANESTRKHLAPYWPSL